MANTIIPKRSSVAAKVPLPGDLEIGEIAVNLADGLIFTKNASGTVITLGGSSGSYLPLAGGTLTGSLTVEGNLLLSANAGGARTIGFASGTDTTLVLQAGGASGAGANLELTRDNIAYVDATLTRLRSQDGATNFLEASASGVNVMTGALTQGGNQVVHAGNVGTYALPIAGGTLTGNLGLGTGVTPLSLLHLGTANPEIRFDDDDASGVVQLRQTIGTFLVTIDPNNVDANSTFLVRLDNADHFTLTTTGATFANGITAPSFTGKVTSRVVSIAEATSITMNADTTDLAVQVNTLAAGTLTINAPTGTPVNGQRIMLRLTSSNVQTFAWNAVFRGSTDQALPTASSGATKEDYLGFIYDSVAGKWDLIAKNFGF
jgi:hypothetical protein